MDQKKQQDEWILNNVESNFFQTLLEERKKSGAAPQVLWGWKRDKVIDGIRQPESRTVYFSADLALDANGMLSIDRAYFFLDTRALERDIDAITSTIRGDRKISRYAVHISTTKVEYYGYMRLRLEVGNPTGYDQTTIARRLKGKPRLFIPPPKLIPGTTSYDISAYAPFAACCGSGLSAESGLPLLGSIHHLFEVDNFETGQLVFGADDTLPARILENVDGEFRKFCQFTVDALKAKPSDSHAIIAKLYQKSIVQQIFTDNIDDLFAKMDIPFIRTRRSIFPDRYPVTFAPEIRGLLVVGVAVDRRDVIKQARKKGLKIISINPVFGVAPHSRNMDYLHRSDIFFREEARLALPKIVEASGF